MCLNVPKRHTWTWMCHVLTHQLSCLHMVTWLLMHQRTNLQRLLLIWRQRVFMMTSVLLLILCWILRLIMLPMPQLTLEKLIRLTFWGTTPHKFITNLWLVEQRLRRRRLLLKRELDWRLGRPTHLTIRRQQRRMAMPIRWQLRIWRMIKFKLNWIRQKLRQILKMTHSTTTWLVSKRVTVWKQLLSRLLVTLPISTKWVCLETLRLLVSSSCQTTQIHVWRNFQQSLVNKTPSKVVQHTQRETFWDSSFHQPTLELSEELTVTWELVGCRMPSPLVSTSSTTQTRVTNNSVATLTRQRWRITIRWSVSVQQIQLER